MNWLHSYEYYRAYPSELDAFLLVLIVFAAMVAIAMARRSRVLAGMEILYEEDQDLPEDSLPSSLFPSPVAWNGLVINRKVWRSTVYSLYSCNNCGTSLKDATLCDICVTQPRSVKDF